MKKIRIGLLGCGTVGCGLAELLRRNRQIVSRRTGLDLEIQRALVRDLRKERPLERSRVTDDPGAVLEAPDVDVVVELMGGIHPTLEHLRRAIEAGKDVVTANKALLARHGTDLLRRAAERKVRLGFEASVCGGIPIIRAISAGLVGNRISTLVGIVNGTCNYILTRMAEEQLPFSQALVEAQKRGFAEADPSLDLDGTDAAQKLQILAEIAFGARPPHGRFPIEGIRHVDLEDVRSASALGFVLKHIVVGRDLGEALDLRVHPALLPGVHPLAHVRHEFNSVLLRGDAVDEMIFTGKGAGPLPTASAVLSDIIEVTRSDPAHGDPIWHLPEVTEKPLVKDLESEHYLRFPIRDVPGVIGLIATALGNHGVSISHAAATLIPEKPGQGNVRILVHRCRESALQKAVSEIARLPVLVGRPVVLRIFTEG